MGLSPRPSRASSDAACSSEALACLLSFSGMVPRRARGSERAPARRARRSGRPVERKPRGGARPCPRPGRGRSPVGRRTCERRPAPWPLGAQAGGGRTIRARPQRARTRAGRTAVGRAGRCSAHHHGEILRPAPATGCSATITPVQRVASRGNATSNCAAPSIAHACVGWQGVGWEGGRRGGSPRGGAEGSLGCMVGLTNFRAESRLGGQFERRLEEVYKHPRCCIEPRECRGGVEPLEPEVSTNCQPRSWARFGPLP